MWAQASRSCGIASGAEAGGMGGRTFSEKICHVIFHDMVIEAHQTTLISLLVILSMKPFFPRTGED